MSIYKLSNTLEHKGVLEIWNDNYLFDILNRYGQTLYINGMNKDAGLIYFINILDPEKPYLYNKIFIGKLRAEDFKFYDTIFRTKKDIVDLKSFIYASPYITDTETLDKNHQLDLSIFKKFSTN